MHATSMRRARVSSVRACVPSVLCTRVLVCKRRAARRRAGKRRHRIDGHAHACAGDARARARREQRAWRARCEQRARVQGGRVGARARQRRGRSRQECALCGCTNFCAPSSVELGKVPLFGKISPRQGKASQRRAATNPSPALPRGGRVVFFLPSRRSAGRVCGGSWGVGRGVRDA
jgi:hypothetical protein